MKRKKKCPLCFKAINIGGKCSCGYNDKIGGIRTMNDKQKILLIIAVVSIVIFISTAYNYTSVGSSGSILGAYRVTMGEPTYHTNWLGIFAIGTFFGSLFGFFLFKDK